MGTNYYVHKEPDLLDKLQGAQPTILHLGKSSGGWCFAMHVQPELGLRDFVSWMRYLRKGKVTIYDEYDCVVSFDEMVHIISKRSFPRNQKIAEIEPECYHPGGCRRHGEDSYGRVKQGVGTYDYFNMDFS